MSNLKEKLSEQLAVAFYVIRDILLFLLFLAVIFGVFASIMLVADNLFESKQVTLERENQMLRRQIQEHELEVENEQLKQQLNQLKGNSNAGID